MESVTEASLRVVTCSGALKLGKIKASSLDVDTAGESQLCTCDQQVLCAPEFQMHPMLACELLLGFGGWGVGGSGAHGFMPVWASACCCC